MKVETLVQGVRKLEVEPGLAQVIDGLVKALGPRVDWRAFGRVPGEQVAASFLRRVRSRAAEPFASSYRFLSPSPFQARHLRDLERVVGADGRRVFEFLCLGRAVSAGELERWIGADLARDLIDRGLIVAHGPEAMAALRMVPAADHFYAADTPAVERHGAGAGLVAAHLTEQTRASLVWLRAALRRRPARRLLELGSGIGLAVLELRDLVPERTGSEINPHAHALARVNQALRRDPGATFVCADLLDGVAGTFDAIFFNPWQPSFRALGLLRRFLASAPAHLRPGGWIGLWVSTHDVAPGVDPVLDLVRDFGRTERFRATRHVVRSWFAGRDVDTLSCLVLDQGGSEASWRVARSAAVPGWRVRRVLAGRA